MGRPLPRGVLTTLPLPNSCVVERVPWFGGTTALHWVPESLRGIEAAGGGTAPGISSKGVIIDGAATYSELLVMDSIPRLVHVRLTTDRPTLVGICLAPGDLLPAREVLESVRWKGESTAGVRGASLPALGNAAPRRDAPVRRVLDRSVVSDMIRLIPTGNGQRRDDRAAYERFDEHGVTLTLPDGDWVVDLTNEGVRVRHLVGVEFAASCLVSVGREWNANDFHSNRKVDTTSLTGDQYTEIGGRYTRWRTTSNGNTELERYAGRKPILRATCSLGGDPLYPVGRQLRGIAFSLRWGDEPETP